MQDVLKTLQKGITEFPEGYFLYSRMIEGDKGVVHLYKHNGMELEEGFSSQQVNVFVSDALRWIGVYDPDYYKAGDPFRRPPDHVLATPINKDECTVFLSPRKGAFIMTKQPHQVQMWTSSLSYGTFPKEVGIYVKSSSGLLLRSCFEELLRQIGAVEVLPQAVSAACDMLDISSKELSVEHAEEVLQYVRVGCGPVGSAIPGITYKQELWDLAQQRVIDQEDAFLSIIAGTEQHALHVLDHVSGGRYDQYVWPLLGRTCRERLDDLVMRGYITPDDARSAYTEGVRRRKTL